ncbi:MAG: hypothetical protein J5934_00395 [Succinivibrio sp.]|nr:hypothetical protein [Succinivibrio sp.]
MQNNSNKAPFDSKIARAQSFEPRVGTAQLIFGIIYAFVTGIAVMIGYYVWKENPEQIPWMQIFFIALFGIMSTKSFFLYSHSKILLMNGVHTVGDVCDIEYVRGITYVRGYVNVEGVGEMAIENRYAGEGVMHDLKHFLEKENTKKLPCLVVGKDSKRPRAMFLIKTYAGKLDPEYINSLKVNKK